MYDIELGEMYTPGQPGAALTGATPRAVSPAACLNEAQLGSAGSAAITGAAPAASMRAAQPPTGCLFCRYRKRGIGSQGGANA
ncbi:hypothetical protein GCM10007388_20850 [Pseudoduganella plicata]|uniref:Uncharacterized protein n=1 Tax=Pseudoduganella plicata TaxID=321984 RepID=A0AA87Y2M4_9BURK|nr:hypothetical protein GCM10007388_20850 [Pseudoduganella plicata]